MARQFLVQARPAGQAVPTLYAARRYNNHHGGRLVVVKRQAKTWLTRKAAERWIQLEQSAWGHNPIYGMMVYEIIQDGSPELAVPEEHEEFVFLDSDQHRVVLPVVSVEDALEQARQQRLTVLHVRYRIAGQKVLGDYRNPNKEKPR